MSGTKQNERRWTGEGRSGANLWLGEEKIAEGVVAWTEDTGRNPLDDLRSERTRVERLGAGLFPDTLAPLMTALALPRPGERTVAEMEEEKRRRAEEVAYRWAPEQDDRAFDRRFGLGAWMREESPLMDDAPDLTSEAFERFRQGIAAYCASTGGGPESADGPRVTLTAKHPAPHEVRTPEEADRLFGRDSERAGLARLAFRECNADHVRVGEDGRMIAVVKQPKTGIREGSVSVDDMAAQFKRLASPEANPHPVPGQVWLPPPGAYHPRDQTPDGTLTVRTVGEESVEFVEGRFVDMEVLFDVDEPWRCIGVATPRGRVMVGDGFAVGSHGTSPVYEVEGVVDGDRVLVQGHPFSALRVMRDRRTHYAPARAGERYRLRGHRPGLPETIVTVDSPDRPGKFRAADGTFHCMLGNSVPVDQWERLRASTSCDVEARVVLALRADRARKPADIGSDGIARRDVRAGEMVTMDLGGAATGPRVAPSSLLSLAKSLGIEVRPEDTDATARARMETTEKGRDLLRRFDKPWTWSTLSSAGPIHLSAAHADLRALHDAIGRVLESTAAHALQFGGHVLTVQRDEVLFSPVVVEGPPCSITADARHLLHLRWAVERAMASGAGWAEPWGKGQRLMVERAPRQRKPNS